MTQGIWMMGIKLNTAACKTNTILALLFQPPNEILLSHFYIIFETNLCLGSFVESISFFLKQSYMVTNTMAGSWYNFAKIHFLALLEFLQNDIDTNIFDKWCTFESIYMKTTWKSTIIYFIVIFSS